MADETTRFKLGLLIQQMHTQRTTIRELKETLHNLERANTLQRTLAAVHDLEQNEKHWPFPDAPRLPPHPITTVACNENTYGAYLGDQLGSSARVAVMDDGLHVIVDVQTRSDLRKLGLSTALVKYITEHDHHDLWLLVRSDNKPAIAVYERNGFRQHPAPAGSELEQWRVEEQARVSDAFSEERVRILVLKRRATTDIR